MSERTEDGQALSSYHTLLKLFSLSEKKHTCGDHDDRLDKSQKIAGEQKGKQNSRSEAYGTSADKCSQICAAHNIYLQKHTLFKLYANAALYVTDFQNIRNIAGQVHI